MRRPSCRDGRRAGPTVRRRPRACVPTRSFCAGRTTSSRAAAAFHAGRGRDVALCRYDQRPMTLRTSLGAGSRTVSPDVPRRGSPIEAMAHGRVPVVSVHVRSAGLIEDGVTGLRIDPARDGDITAALGPLIDDAGLRERLSGVARHFARPELPPAHSVARVEALLPDR